MGEKQQWSNELLEKVLEKLVKVLENLLNPEPATQGPTVQECYENLKIVALPPTDPLVLAAFYIFGVSVQMREAWMILPAEPEVLEGWIKGIATTLGYLE